MNELSEAQHATIAAAAQLAQDQGDIILAAELNNIILYFDSKEQARLDALFRDIVPSQDFKFIAR